MFTELKPMIDGCESVTVILNKSKTDGQYIATLLAKGGNHTVQPIQIEGTADEMDDEISKAFNEVAEIHVDTAASIAAYKAEAEKQKESAKPGAKKTAAKKAAKKTAAKKTAAKKAEPKPDTGADLTAVDDPGDADEALKKLGLA